MNNDNDIKEAEDLSSLIDEVVHYKNLKLVTFLTFISGPLALILFNLMFVFYDVPESITFRLYRTLLTILVSFVCFSLTYEAGTKYFRLLERGSK